jgi:hypothetical protein
VPAPPRIGASVLGSARGYSARDEPCCASTFVKREPMAANLDPYDVEALDVEPQDVVLRQRESADRCFITDAGMRSVPVIAV